MGRHDWYRNADWNHKIESAFFAKLKRARDKSQYLRIQASTLANEHPRVALRLLDEYFKLSDNFDMAQAYVDTATAFLALDQPYDAIESFEAALAREAEHPGMQTQAYLDLPYLIVDKEMRDKYIRATELLDLHKDRIMFPVDRYKWNAAKAIIISSHSDDSEAKPFAQAALDATDETKSGFRYHPRIGLVRSRNQISKIHKKLKRIAQ